MPTPEERLNSLERTVALLEKRFEDADVRSVNHNATMLLGMALKQQDDIKEIKNTINEHTAILNENTKLLTQMFAMLTKLSNG